MGKGEIGFKTRLDKSEKGGDRKKTQNVRGWREYQ